MAIKLKKRERYAIYAAGVFICLFVGLQFIVFPFMDKREQVQRTLQAKTRILADMVLLNAEYETLRYQANSAKSRFARRPKGFTLFSFLDNLAGKARIKSNITYMKPSTSIQKNSPYKLSLVEMKLQAVTLSQLTTYLHMVETSPSMVRVKRLSILKKETQKNGINVVLQVETLET